MDAREIRAAALLAAARGAVNPGVVIENARRFATWIESNQDIGATPVKVPPKDTPATCGRAASTGKPCPDHPAKDEPATGLCRDDCAFLDGRGFCTCGGQPELMRTEGR